MTTTQDNNSQKNNHFGVVLVNLGSPSAPTKKAVKEFLLSFLSDYRVVDKPSWLWQPILRGIIIPLRLKKVTHAYNSIWTDNGSPLIAISKQQQQALQSHFNEEDVNEHDIHVELAMTYNQPSLKNAFARLQDKGINKIVILPLYPQYSSTTSAAVFDAVANTLKSAKRVPELRSVQDYYQHPLYIKALANSIKEKQKANEHSQLLIFSFHGLPQRYITLGDPYQKHCEVTAQLVAKELGLTDKEWIIAYQSRVGREPWLQPYLDKTLEELPQQGVKNVTVICPAFSADCLETLEEIEIENKALFIESGGEHYDYIPALNANRDHIEMMSTLVKEQLVGW